MVRLYYPPVAANWRNRFSCCGRGLLQRLTERFFDWIEILGGFPEALAQINPGPDVSDEKPVQSRVDQEGNGKRLGSRSTAESRRERFPDVAQGFSDLAELDKSEAYQDLGEPVRDLVEIGVRRQPS